MFNAKLENQNIHFVEPKARSKCTLKKQKVWTIESNKRKTDTKLLWFAVRTKMRVSIYFMEFGFSKVCFLPPKKSVTWCRQKNWLFVEKIWEILIDEKLGTIFTRTRLRRVQDCARAQSWVWFLSTFCSNQHYNGKSHIGPWPQTFKTFWISRFFSLDFQFELNLWGSGHAMSFLISVFDYEPFFSYSKILFANDCCLHETMTNFFAWETIRKNCLRLVTSNKKCLRVVTTSNNFCMYLLIVKVFAHSN